MATAHAVEEIIRMIPGVAGVRVALDNGVPIEVHVLASSGRHPMQIVRDIESAVVAHSGIRLDRRVISVAQLAGERVEPPRLMLDTVQLRLTGDTTDVQVELALGDSTYTGAATGTSSRQGRISLAAQATLRAVASSLNGTVQFYLDGVALARIGDADAVVTTVLMRDGASEQLLVGSCYVWRDEAESAARAALGAVNRRYGLLRKALLEVG